MAFNPLLYPQTAYLGPVYGLPMQFCTPVNDTPKMVPLVFNWASYGVSQADPSIGTQIDLTQGTTPPIKQIRGVYIDNTGSEASIFVYFPDTGHIITCAPYSTSFAPVLTNGLVAGILARGFATDTAAQTRIFLLNTPVNPGVSAELNVVYPQWRASPQISRGQNIYTSGFAIPAIGDQWNQGLLTQPNGTTTVPLFGSPYTQGGLITLTDMWAVVTNQSGAQSDRSTVKLASTGVSGTVFEFKCPQLPNTGTASAGNPIAEVVSQNGLQLKLNAGETWNLTWQSTNALALCFLSYRFGFSYQGEQAQTFGTIGTYTAAAQPIRSIGGGSPEYGGVRFTAPANGTVFFASLFAVTGTGSYHLELWTDSGGSPSAQVGSDSASRALTGSELTEMVFTFSDPPAIVSGQTYWIVMASDNPGAYQLNAQNVSALAGFTSGRNNSITAMVGNSINGTDEWKMSITYQTL